MRKSFAIILSAFILLAATSCDLQKKRLQKCQKWGVCNAKDSIVIKDSIAYDTTMIDNSDFWTSILFECDSNGQVLIKVIDSLKTHNMQLQMSLKDNKLVQYVNVPAQILKRPIYFHTQSGVNTVTITTNELTRWQMFEIWCGRVIILIVLAGVIWFVIAASKWFKSLWRE